jgi:VWFA-related protein
VATIHSNSNLVVIDVVATDAQQNSVRHLTASDFTVTEKGVTQNIGSLEEHTLNEPVQLPPLPKLGPGTFTNYSPTLAAGTLNILLLDRLNTPLPDQAFVRDQVLKYLKEARPGTRMAIFGLNTQLRLLQGFTSDPELLRTVLNGKKAGAQGSPLLNNPMSGNTAGQDNPMLDTAEDVFGNSPDGAAILANLQQFQAEQESFQLQLRARYTLDAFNQLGRYLSRLPGRKNLIWFSGSFPINILPDGDLQNPFGVVASSEEEFRETIDLLTRAQVAVYPVDTRGLMTNPTLNASISGKGFAKNPSSFAKADTKFFQQTASEHGTMTEMAEATGGKAFVNTNDLEEAVRKAIEAGSNYYELTYTPTNRNWNGEYRKIQIKVSRPGVTLGYRRGYYANDPNAPVRHGDSNLAAKDAGTYSPMRTAMLRGGPDPTEIIFAANVRPTTADSEPALTPGNKASAKLTGPFRRYSVLYTITPKDVSCPTTPDNSYQCVLEFFTFVYDVDGVLLNQQSNGIKADIPAARYAAIRHKGIQYRQEISVPVKGEVYLRIGVQDETTGHVGALELPIVAVSKLTPLSVQATVPK